MVQIHGGPELSTIIGLVIVILYGVLFVAVMGIVAYTAVQGWLLVRRWIWGE